jgi:hypothetical protein
VLFIKITYNFKLPTCWSKVHWLQAYLNTILCHTNYGLYIGMRGCFSHAKKRCVLVVHLTQLAWRYTHTHARARTRIHTQTHTHARTHTANWLNLLCCKIDACVRKKTSLFECYAKELPGSRYTIVVIFGECRIWLVSSSYYGCRIWLVSSVILWM